MAESTMQWDKVNSGRLPPAGLTYEDWIICQAREKSGKGQAGGRGDAREPGIIILWCLHNNIVFVENEFILLCRAYFGECLYERNRSPHEYGPDVIPMSSIHGIGVGMYWHK